MLTRILAAGVIAAAVLAVPATARAQVQAPAQSQDMADIKANCMQDVQRLCKGVKPGGGRIVQCLKVNEKDISAGCTKALQDHKAKKQAQ